MRLHRSLVRTALCVLSMATCVVAISTTPSFAGWNSYGSFQSETAQLSAGWKHATSTTSPTSIGFASTLRMSPSVYTYVSGSTMAGSITVDAADLASATGFAVIAAGSSGCTSTSMPLFDVTMRTTNASGATVTSAVGKIPVQRNDQMTRNVVPLREALLPNRLGQVMTFTLTARNLTSNCGVIVGSAGLWQIGVVESQSSSRSVSGTTADISTLYAAPSGAARSLALRSVGSSVTLRTNRLQPLNGTLKVFAGLEPSLTRAGEPLDAAIPSSTCSAFPKLEIRTDTGMRIVRDIHYTGWHKYTFGDGTSILDGATRVTVTYLKAGSKACGTPVFDFAHGNYSAA